MSCEQTEQVLRDEAENLALGAHAGACDDCARALAAVRSARRTLLEHEIVVPAGSKRRAWAELEKRHRRSQLWQPVFAFAGAFAVAGVVVSVWPGMMQAPVQMAENETRVEPSLEAAVPQRISLTKESPKETLQGERPLQVSELQIQETALDPAKIAQQEKRDVVTKQARVKSLSGRAVISTPELDATLREAKAALPKDAPRAAELAEQVLDAAPKTTPLEAEALAVLADAERRRGRNNEAAALYARVVLHPAGEAFAEEALQQRALIFARTDNNTEALAVLAIAEKRFPAGPTAPERAALFAELALKNGDPLGAADAIDRANNMGRSLKLLARRVEVARALLPQHRERAHALLAPVLDARTPAALRADAELLMKK